MDNRRTAKKENIPDPPHEVGAQPETGNYQNKDIDTHALYDALQRFVNLIGAIRTEYRAMHHQSLDNDSPER